MPNLEPLSIERLQSIFRTSTKNALQIINREGTTIEFKESYNHGNMAQYFKAIAAFANNIGGYIIFGVVCYSVPCELALYQILQS